jgi:DNA-binding cell septation regulator SpoVG
MREIKLLYGQHGYFLEMPKLKRPGKHALPVAFPRNEQTRQIILQAVLAEYEKVAANR